MQHSHDRLGSSLEMRDGRDSNVNNLSSDEERTDSQLVILNSKGGTYKLRDSRIIEIAGGRELYSQSRTKAVRKLRHSNTHKHNLRNKVRSLNKDTVTDYAIENQNHTNESRTKAVRKLRHSNTHKHNLRNKVRSLNKDTVTDYAIENQNHTNEIPLHRLNNTMINSEPKKMISRHTSPTYTNGDREPLENMGIPRTCSPILDPHKTNDVSTKSSPIAVVADGEVVVFDDNDDWKGLRMDPEASDNEIDMSVKRTLDNMKNGDNDVMNNKSEVSCDGGSESTPSREEGRLSDASPSGVWLSGDEDKGRVTRVIGELPIAEYEGSPRRYGVGQKPAVKSPRPGFPQRVVTESRDPSPPPSSAAFDYLYEFSETRKVLEEFFRCPAMHNTDEIVNFQDLDYELRRQTQDCPSENGLEGGSESEWPHVTDTLDSPHTAHNHTNFLGLQQQRERYPDPNVSELSVGAAWSGSASPAPPRQQRGPFALSPDTSDDGSDLSLILMENELSEMKELSVGAAWSGSASPAPPRQQRGPFALSPDTSDDGSDLSLILMENELSEMKELSVGAAWSGSASPAPPRQQRGPFALSPDTSDDGSDLSLILMENELSEMKELSVGAAWSGSASPAPPRQQRGPFALSPDTSDDGSDLSLILMENELSEMKVQMDSNRMVVTHLPIVEDGLSSGHASDTDNNNQMASLQTHTSVIIEEIVENGTSSDPLVLSDADLHSLDPLACRSHLSARHYHTRRTTIIKTHIHGKCTAPPPPAPAPHRPPAEPPVSLSVAPVSAALPHEPHHHHQDTHTRKRPSSAQSQESVEIKPASGDEDEADTDLETDRLLGQQRTDDQGFFDDKGWRKPKSRTVMPANSASSVARSPHAHDDNRDDDAAHNGKDKDGKKKSKNKEDPSVLIEGVLFRARYLGSTQLACEGQPTKATRMLQAEEAVSRIKAPEGENQPSTEVDLFISTEKIMVLNTELKEIMMDHALRTISYIADIGDLVVLMARRRFVPHETDSDQPKLNRTPKMICHVFESEEAQFIAQSIGQAFQVAYMEFLKANGIEDHSFVKEMDYQEVLNSQEIFGDELQMFAKKELQKEVVVPKTKGEILGVVVVESGWGSMLPTVVIANLAPAGAAARCGQLNIGDQIIAINGVSLVGLPLSTCQTYIKNSKNQTVVKLTVVPCAPVVEVKIKRPDTKYQLGFSVQNGVICSLLRGGIAERGGVRVGHRIIEINSQSVVAVPHERIVNLLATSVGEILMKTMPTSMFRLLTGQENPVFI
ncbi:phosphotyrosine interaction domain (PTB/PID) domain-containing protein [Phthorimaea operculella]|nr:phosphotyrosine interaction domain (PTB/PID) domain-containing protein [Phthorimaea operculella]